jgi:hypothetical protein
MQIILIDGDREETFASLAEAAEAAKTWYASLAGDKLPEWNHEIRTFNDLLTAIEDHKARLAKVLGYGSEYHLKLRLRASEVKWGRPSGNL